MVIYKHARELIPNRWYAIGFRDENNVIDYSRSDLYKYVGAGQWEDERGESVDGTIDPFLQLFVSVNSADEYLLQS